MPVTFANMSLYAHALEVCPALLPCSSLLFAGSRLSDPSSSCCVLLSRRSVSGCPSSASRSPPSAVGWTPSFRSTSSPVRRALAHASFLSSLIFCSLSRCLTATCLVLSSVCSVHVAAAGDHGHGQPRRRHPPAQGQTRCLSSRFGCSPVVISSLARGLVVVARWWFAGEDGVLGPRHRE